MDTFCYKAWHRLLLGLTTEFGENGKKDRLLRRKLCSGQARGEAVPRHPAQSLGASCADKQLGVSHFLETGFFGGLGEMRPLSDFPRFLEEHIEKRSSWHSWGLPAWGPR